MLDFDEQASRALERVYQTADVVEQRRVVMGLLAPAPGERALDLGCGPGLLACQIARAVGAEGRLVGLDASPSMLAIAARRDCGPAAARLELVEADAGAPLPAADGEFDLAVATQVYEYVPGIAAALEEARRVLRTGGRLLVLDTDWDSLVWRSPDDGLMARVMAAWDAHLAHRDLPRRLPELLAAAGFALESTTVVPMLTVGDPRETYSGGLLDLVAGFSAGRAGVTPAEVEEWAAGLHGMGEGYFFCLNRFVFLARSQAPA